MITADSHEIAGLAIGQTWEDPNLGQLLRVVAIDPEMHSMEAEDGAGFVVVDDIMHFRSTHVPWPLAG
ncbi:MAG: hypothetical protein NVSMB12_11780 [Acidimicrobiales bacterium]